MKKINKKNLKKFCVMVFQWGGVYVPMVIFPIIIIHKNNNCPLKI